MITSNTFEMTVRRVLVLTVAVATMGLTGCKSLPTTQPLGSGSTAAASAVAGAATGNAITPGATRTDKLIDSLSAALPSGSATGDLVLASRPTPGEFGGSSAAPRIETPAPKVAAKPAAKPAVKVADKPAPLDLNKLPLGSTDLPNIDNIA